MKGWLLTVFSLLLLLAGTNMAFAAFPVKDAAQNTRDEGFKELVNTTIDRLTGKSSSANPTLPLQSEEAAESGWQGALSFGLGAAGIVALIAAFAFPVVAGLLGLGILFGIMAIVFGAMGFRKPNHSLAVAGFVLGIVNLGLLLLLLLIVALAVAAFYK